MKCKNVLIICLLCLLLAAPAAAASVSDASGKTYTTYDQIYASTTLSSAEKLALVQEMAGWTPELEAYLEWKNSGGLEAYQAAVSGGNSTSSDYGWDEAPGDGLGDGGTSIEPEYSYQERQAYDAAYEAYLQEFAVQNRASETGIMTPQIYNSWSAWATANGESGSGTQANPYTITSAESFMSMLVCTASSSGVYFANDEVIKIDISNYNSITPNTFYGNLDGKLDIFVGDYTFNPVEFSGATVKNLYLHDIVNVPSTLFRTTNSILNGFQISFIDNPNLPSGSDSSFLILLRDTTVSDFFVENYNIYRDVSAGDNQAVFGIRSDYTGDVSNCIIISENTNTINTASVSNQGSGFIIGRWSIFSAPKLASVSDSVVLGNTMQTKSSISGFIGVNTGTTYSNNYVLSTAEKNGATPTTNNPNNYNGGIVTPETATTQNFYQTTLNWDFENTWYWDDTAEWQDATGTTYKGLPKLQVFKKSTPPTISAISATPSIGGQQNTYTLSVSATTEAAGGIASYQWYGRIGSSGEWTPISGATSATYQFVPGDQALGDIYFKCVITGADGGVVDSYDAGYTDVKITIILAPQISNAAANPTSGPLTQTVQLSASVTSTETATYQWQELIGSVWTDISGATAATATVSIADSTATTHSYRLLATNVGGTSTSATVTYTSVAPPTISSVTANPTTGPLTQSVTLSATVTGATAYQWQQQTGSTWVNIQGATSATYTVSIADTAATLHSYRLQATNVGGTTTSATVTYQSVAAPAISAVSATPTTGPLTQTVQLSATVTGATAYQWQQQSGSTWVNIQGATSATYTVSIADTAATLHSYRLQATNIGGTTTSATVTYQSVAAPVISAVSATPTTGPLTQTVQLSATVTGATAYQWQQQTGGSWTNIQGATSATYTVSIADTAATLHSYRLQATNVGGTTTSNTVTYQSVLPPAISAVSANPASGPLTQTVQLSVSATGAGRYQWQEQISGSWTAISGATSATVSVNIADNAPTLHTYRVIVTGIGGTVTSSEVTYQSSQGPLITNAAANPTTGPLTQTVQLSATVSSDYAISYQWQEQVGSSWENIAGATSASFAVSVADSVATLHQYRLQASNVGGVSFSSVVMYQSVAPPVFSSVSVSPTSGAMPLTVSYSAEASDTSGYRWEYSAGGSVWVQMSSGASGSFTFTDAGTYSVRVVATGTGGQTYSSAVSVDVVDYSPVFSSVSVSPTAGVVPFSVTFTAEASNSPRFVWEQRQGSSWVAVGEGSPFTLSIPYGTESGTLSFRAQASNEYGSAVSSVLTVSVGAPPKAEIVSPSDGSTFAVGRPVSFSAAAVSGAAYSWDFGDGSSAAGRSVSHTFAEEGMYTVRLTASNEFGSARDEIRVVLVVPTGEIFVSASDVSSVGAQVVATVEVSPVDPGTLVWFEVSSTSGQVVMRSPEFVYSGPVSWEASGLPLMAGESYRVVAKSNYYGYSLPVSITLVDAVAGEYEPLGSAFTDSLQKNPFNVSALVAAGIGMYGGAMGGGAVGSTVAFGVIVMFVLVGLWLRQQDIVVPLTLVLVAGWFVIGNLPGEWQPIAYTLMVVAVVAIFFYLFRKRVE